MNKPLCSFLIPSRGRPSGLVTTIQSIRHCSPEGEYECLVRLDDDDVATLEILPTLHQFPCVKVFIGPKPKHGYASVCDIISELMEAANGIWVCMIDDDVTLEGNWASTLRTIPTEGVFVKTERYRLESNTYIGLGRPEGWFAPNGCWKRVAYPVGGHSKIMHPIDIQMRHILVDDNGWKEVSLPGTLYNHAHWKRGEEEKARKI